MPRLFIREYIERKSGEPSVPPPKDLGNFECDYVPHEGDFVAFGASDFVVRRVKWYFSDLAEESYRESPPKLNYVLVFVHRRK